MKAFEANRLPFDVLDNPSFLCTNSDLATYMSERPPGKRYTHDSAFYRWQRRRLKVLMPEDGRDPAQWTYDKENRKSLPENLRLPPTPRPIVSPYVEEARAYVAKHFGSNPGRDEDMPYPIDSETSLVWLRDFLARKLDSFGPYQDAVTTSSPFVFHSVLTPMMNVGLLPARVVINETLKYADANKVPVASLEGFIRQVIGWREYVRLLYVYEGEKQRKMNTLSHTRKLSPAWYTGRTGLPPVDDAIKKCLRWCYLHHIERLMYVGNAMLLCGLDPNEAYAWFMELFIDAYDWVMIPNVYGMSQFADGGLMMTRPYFSASNYILKMSSYRKGKKVNIRGRDFDWSEVWDSLYYSFVARNEERFSKIYATGPAVANWRKKSPVEQKRLLTLADEYLREYLSPPDPKPVKDNV
eukprot:TRINITY_DN9485_c0_g1_i2.p1 TRINITY_DN9485_c0_g1~~TRINITY_DN9485_c0_g1_i2.p1  ORF type:complete len:411 (+),score=76.76 TRINITY_DN9485_c0_g1_i2:168-1400(+)